MATIRPFAALRFDPEKTGDVSKLLAPPYDVLNPEQAAARRDADPHAIVHVTLPVGEGDTRYEKAARLLVSWREQGILRADDGEAFYVYHQRCRGESRSGFYARVRLATYDKREVLPHERTHAGPKKDRLSLYRASAIQPEPIFLLYRDDGAGLLAKLESAPGKRLLGRAVVSGPGVPDEVEEELYRVNDPDALAAVCDAVRSRSLYIADGHHRYETSIAYEQERVAAGADADEGDHHYVMALLVAADGPLSVHPTHRVVTGTGLGGDGVRHRIRSKLSTEPLSGEDVAQWYQRLLETDGSAAVVAYPDGTGDLIRFSPQADDAPAEKRLDVARLNDDLLLGALDVGSDRRPIARHIVYVQGAAAAVERVRTGGAEAALLLKPTPPQSVLDVSDQGGVMPQKSTYFFPKLSTGWVLNPL